MNLNKVLSAALASTALLAASPALAQSSGPASDSVPVSASISESQLTLEVDAFSALEFGEVTRPTGVVSGAQCRYTMVVDTTNFGVPQVSLAEIRNGSAFDDSFPTPSGCEARTGDLSWAIFTVRCTPATPVTIRAEWASEGLQGLAVTPAVRGVYETVVGGSTTIRNFNPVVNQVVNCSEDEDPAQHTINVLLGGTLTVDANAELGSELFVGSITLNATY